MLSALPTEEKPLTEEGSILGTFQYMAPEQLEGKEADARTDIFAFGSVLYEMLTGKKAFEGKSQASLISAIMSSEPRTDVGAPADDSAVTGPARRALSGQRPGRTVAIGAGPRSTVEGHLRREAPRQRLRHGNAPRVESGWRGFSLPSFPF